MGGQHGSRLQRCWQNLRVIGLRSGMGVRLPGEASPAKVAKEDQHKNDDEDDPKNREASSPRDFSRRPLLFPGVLGGGDKRNAQS